MGRRLQVQWDLQEEKFQIPPLTIQPLVENAVCHGICQKMEGGTVQIRSFRKNGEICVQILDDGAGFDTEKLKDADGIAIRNLKLRLKEFLNADLRLRAEKEKGAGRQYIFHGRRQKMKIILIDDEPLILEELSYLCEKHKDIEICGKFVNPKQALQYVAGHPVDFAFCDIRMPGITGLELLDQMHKEKPDLQAAFVTAYDSTHLMPISWMPAIIC